MSISIPCLLSSLSKAEYCTDNSDWSLDIFSENYGQTILTVYHSSVLIDYCCTVKRL